MTTENYDGETNLQPAIAALCGCSFKNQGKIAKLIKQAKDALGIEGKYLTNQQRAAVYKWHADKLVTADDMATADDLAVIADNLTSGNEPVEYKQVNIDGSIEQTKADLYPAYTVVKLAFYTENDGIKERRGIDIKGYFLNALMAKTGIDKKSIPAWIQNAVTHLDTRKKLTEQVENLIIEQLLK